MNCLTVENDKNEAKCENEIEIRFSCLYAWNKPANIEQWLISAIEISLRSVYWPESSAIIRKQPSIPFVFVAFKFNEVIDFVISNIFELVRIGNYAKNNS